MKDRRKKHLDCWAVKFPQGWGQMFSHHWVDVSKPSLRRRLKHGIDPERGEKFKIVPVRIEERTP